jgi:hypothetical protein
LASAPYWDDYNEDKNYYRILFRPSVAVQARELTQMQTILQQQIERFGDNVFKDGSIVQGCSIEYITDLEYIGIEDQFINNSSLAQNDSRLIGSIAIGQTSDVQALIVSTQAGFIRQNPGRFFIRYTKPGINAQRTFIPGEQINVYNENTSYVEDVILTVDNITPFANALGLAVTAVTTANTANVTARAIIVDVNPTNNTIKVNNIKRRFNTTDTLYLSANTGATAVIANVGYDVSSLLGEINTLTANTDGIAIANTDIAGFAYGAHVTDGVIYHKGFFIKVQPSDIIVNPNSNDPSNYLLGFVTTENVITETTDSSLYDNALGSTNYNAPGAHRLNLVSTLTAKLANTVANTDVFFPVVTFSNTGVAYDRTDPQYAALGDSIAQRTYEESGHFIVNPFGVSSGPDSSDTNGVIYEVTPGLAYVKGYRNELLSNLPVSGRRGTDTNSFDNQIVTMSYGNYLPVQQVRGYFPTDHSSVVNLYASAQHAVSNNLTSGSATTGTLIGTANIRELVYQSGVKGSANAVYNAYLFNIQMANSSLSFSNVASLAYIGTTTGNAFADVISTPAVLQESSYVPMLFSVGATAVKTLADANGVSQSQYYYTASNTSVSIDSSGNITFKVPSGGGILGFSDGSDISEKHIDVVAGANIMFANLVSASGNLYANGVVSGPGLGGLVLPGELIVHGGNTYLVASTIDANTVQVANTITLVANTGQTFGREILAGSLISLNGTGRTLTINANNQATISMGSAPSNAPVAIDLRFYTLQNQAQQIAKQIQRGTCVAIHIANTGTDTGPWNLGIPDGLRLVGAYVMEGSNSSTATADFNSDFSGLFHFNNGQTDAFYDHCSVSLINSADANTFANTTMIMMFDHFVANTTAGKGYFSVDSYPVDDSIGADANVSIHTYDIPTYFSTSLSKSFDLRDTIDFRPYKQATANVTNDIRAATWSPATTNTFDANTSAFKPFPGENFELNYTHYLGRIDQLTLTPAGTFLIIEGVPSLTPIAPAVSNDSLGIATAIVPPYPSLTDLEKSHANNTTYNISLSVQQHERFTMSAIAALEQRIERLEYYTTLNTLQLAAANTLVLSADGNNRFKNGIFVDPFTDHSFGDVSNPLYQIAIDETNGIARPYFTPEYFEMSFDLQNSAGVTAVGNQLLMSYGETEFLSQGFATGARALSGAPPSYVGTLTLSPSVWNQVETTISPVTVTAQDAAATALAGMIAPALNALYGWWRTDDALGTTANTVSNTAIVPLSSSTIASANTIAAIQSYISPRVVAFSASGLKPYTVFNIYIDDIDVSQFAAPGSLSNTVQVGITTGSAALDDSIVQREQIWGSQLESDSRGNLCGKISIPFGRFKIGSHTVKLLSQDIDVLTQTQVSSAAALFKVTVSYVDPPKPIVVVPPAPPAPPPAPPPSPPNTIVVPPPAPPPSPPSAKFNWSGATYVQAPANHSISFSDASTKGTGTITSWLWSFGDGTTYSGQTPPAHTYGAGIGTQSTNPYTVTLTVTDSNGLKASYSQTITLYKLAPPPTATLNIICYSNATLIGTGNIGGVYEANINMIATTNNTVPGAYFVWSYNVISGHGLSATIITGTANNTFIPRLIDTNTTGSANLNSTFIATTQYVAANGFVIASTNTQFSLWTLGSPVITGGSTTGGGGGGGGCVVVESWLNNETRAAEVGTGFFADTWKPGDMGVVKREVEKIGEPKLNACVLIETVSGIQLMCSVDTPFNLKHATSDLQDGEWKWAPEMLDEEVMVDDDGEIRWEKVSAIYHVGEKLVVPLAFHDSSFAAGILSNRRIFSHNLTAKKF